MLVGVEESGREAAMFEFTMADPRQMYAEDKRKGIPRHVCERRRAHKKAFTIRDVNKLFFLPECPHVVSLYDAPNR